MQIQFHWKAASALAVPACIPSQAKTEQESCQYEKLELGFNKMTHDLESAKTVV
jgi:hypothetical protein